MTSKLQKLKYELLKSQEWRVLEITVWYWVSGWFLLIIFTALFIEIS
ncbi:hypothetical protein [Candidatus Albibeggiatoa sp. nov. NOAA]|nr:hypothetical protein [Thiotrichaceae bacterium]